MKVLLATPEVLNNKHEKSKKKISYVYTVLPYVLIKYIYSLRAFEEASILHYLAQREYILRDFKRNKEEEEEEEKKRKETKKKSPA